MTSSQGSYVDALRHRDFRLLTIAQTPSKMGDWDYGGPVQDEPADALYVLAGGRAEVTVRAADGASERVRLMDAPCYFGEIGVLQHIPRTATAAAVDPCVLWRIDSADFLAALTQTPLSAAFMSGMNLRLQRTGTTREATIPAPRTADRIELTEPVSPREIP